MSNLRLQGASGRDYDYSLVDVPNVHPSGLGGAAANFPFVRSISSTENKIVFVGETSSLFAMLAETQLWPSAQRRFGVTALYARPNGREAGRRQEPDDLVEAYKPPMNEEDSK